MQEPGAITVAIVEDQRPTREALAALVHRAPGFRVVGSFSSVEDAMDRLRESPDVALLDIGLPGMSGIEGIAHLKDRHPRLQILMLTVYADNTRVFEAVCAGASGYLLKDTPKPKLLDAIREVGTGGAPFTPEIARKVVTMFQQIAPPRTAATSLSLREVEVLQLLADGHAYKTAADELSISTDTIRFHIRNIYEKLHVHSKSEAVLKAFKQGLLR